MIRIISGADVGRDGIKTFVYGAAGVGKTPLCATAPAPFIISGEKGLLSIKSNTTWRGAEFSTYEQLTEICGWAMNSHESRQYYTLCLDSLSEVAEVILINELKKSKDPRKAYGNVITEGLNLVRWFRDLPGRSVVVVAKEIYDKDESTGAMLYGPLMPGAKLAPQIPYFFDEVFRMLVGKDNQGRIIRYLRTARTFQEVARDRSGLLAEYEPADLTHIYRKILQV